MVGFSRLAFECFSTADDLDEFVGDGRLAGVVVLEFEIAEDFRGVVSSFGHGNHAGTMFGSDGVAKGFV